MTALAEPARVGSRPLPLRTHPAAIRRAPGNPQSAAASLHVLTCGSVDDGKSTLIGRLLWDAGALHADQEQTLRRSAATAAGTPDFSLLVDGLAAEREQGITIDVAWRYFDAPARRLVIIDSPGHEQYTRNMATGASHADVAILLVDARSGLKLQTRRHAAILSLMGVERVVLAVNKMDLAGWSSTRFREIEGRFRSLCATLGFRNAVAIPLSAVLGDNVAWPSAAMPWYAGPTLLDHLQAVPTNPIGQTGHFRFPVQMVVRAGQDFRGLAGTVASGRIAVGDELVDAASARRAHVKRIVTMGRDLARAVAGQAVVLQLDTDMDISRGAVLAAPRHQPQCARAVDARIVWLSDEPFNPARRYLLRAATDLVPVASIAIAAHLDLDTLAERPAAGCAVNDIAVARVELGRKAVLEPFSEQRATGSFILIDVLSGATVAAGIVTAVDTKETDQARDVFVLTRTLLRQGIAADLGQDLASEEELRRRAREVAILLQGAGVAVEIEDLQSTARYDATTVWLALLTLLSFGFIAAVLCGVV